jgi:hypothetical protein
MVYRKRSCEIWQRKPDALLPIARQILDLLDFHQDRVSRLALQIVGSAKKEQRKFTPVTMSSRLFGKQTSISLNGQFGRRMGEAVIFAGFDLPQDSVFGRVSSF